MKKLILTIFTLMFVLNFISASPPNPPNPMAFFGEVNYSENIPEGYYITAKINNAIHGQCLIVNNTYGYGENACVVVSDYNGVSINFYIGDLWIGIYNFDYREIVNLNFVLETLPPRPPILSNGVCEPSLGECSFNFLDCHVSLTNACAENSRCDVEIGETCSNTPGDCGVCPTTASSNSGGSPSSSSSGGGGAAPSTTSLSDSTNPITDFGSNENNERSPTGSESLADTKKGINWLTGAIIGSFGNANYLVLWTLVILIAAALVVFFATKEKIKK